ncbi:MAG: TIGR03842 family LLM class F420-dependent oxidoreductase [Candidatus Dormibacteria bacterium]
MEFGIVLQTDPPARRTVELAKTAERAGFTHVWTFDSVVLWQEPFVIYSQILASTERIIVGPMVTNPVTRDPTVTASLFATLNEMFGPRTICGIGRGDSAVRVTGGGPANLDLLAETIAVVKGLAEGREVQWRGKRLRLPWVTGGQLQVLMGAYGPKALEVVGRHADGLILQLGDPSLVRWAIDSVRAAADRAGRDPLSLKICVAAPAYVGDDLAHQREQLRWFGGMVGNHVAEIVRRYGPDSELVPQALTDYIKDRQGYDYSHHGRAGNPSTDFVPDQVVDRFCVLGPISSHLERMRALAALGVDQFAIYLMHDQQESTMAAYGSEVIPALAGG